MDKRALSKIKLSEADEHIFDMFTQNEKAKYIVSTNTIAEGLLVLAIYEKKEVVLSKKASYAVFLTKEDYLTRDLKESKIKWMTGALSYILGYYYYSDINKSNVFAATDNDLNVIRDFVHEHIEKEDKTIWDALDRLQEKIKLIRLHRRHAKERADIDEKMFLFGNMPEDFNEYIDREVMKNSQYMIYSREKRSAFCTGCKVESRLDREGKLCTGELVKHNAYGYCPHCGRYVQYKSSGMPRTKMIDEGWGIIVQKSGSNILTRYVDVFKDYRDDYKNPVFNWYEIFRTVHTRGKAYEYEWTQFHGKYETRWCRIEGDRIHSLPFSVVLYEKNFSSVFEDTDYRYCMIDVYMKKIKGHRDDAWFIDKYLKKYDKYRFVEQLMKIGFYELARYTIENYSPYGDSVSLKDAKTIPEILCITRNSFKLLREFKNPAAGYLSVIQKAEAAGFTLSKDQVVFLDGRYDINRYFNLMRYTTLFKLMKYLNMTAVKSKSSYDSHRDYFDYIKWLGDLGYDMRNEFNLFQKNFTTAHDRLMEEHQAYEELKAKDELKKASVVIRQMMKDYKKISAMKLKKYGLIIVVPEDGNQIRNEGQILHHCVGSYVTKVANGETLIFYVRKEEEPDKPYFTMEWKGKVVQCRGKFNCSMPFDVENFVKEFEKQMEIWSSEKINKRKKAG